MAASVCVIGAGMAGLTAARDLSASGFAVSVFEKSRGLGGRLATRLVREQGPAHGLTFDHGAPYVTATEAPFRALLDTFRSDGSAAEWRGATAPTGAVVGAPGMNALVNPLAEGLDVRFQARAFRLTRHGAAVDVEARLGGDRGDIIRERFDAVLCCAPADQTAALCSGGVGDAANAAVMDPVWTFMVAAPAMPTIAAPPPPFSHVIREEMKPGRAPAPARAVLHAEVAWTRRNLELEKPAALEAAASAIESAIGAPREDWIYATAHRWRFARTQNPVGQPFVADTGAPIWAAGDWLLGPSAEDAYLSGRAVAGAIRDAFGE